MSVKLISILLKHLNGETEYKPEKKIIPAKLMIRESSKRKNRQ
jgi:DNA-binding LacI/PurR family transcriptional regulator